MRHTLAAICLLSLVLPVGAAEVLRAGVAEVDITPPKGARMAGYFRERFNTGTHDPLHAKAVVFEQGDRRAALVFCDLVAVPRAVALEARDRASAASGIPAGHIGVAATHSHTGPLYYGELYHQFHDQAVADHGTDPHEPAPYANLLVQRIAEVVTRARQAALPVRLLAGVAREEHLSFNRRFHMKDGTVRFNPGVLNPDIVRPAGPIDPDVGLVMLETLHQEAAFACLTVFALHLDTVGGTDYSADFPYYLADELRRRHGDDFVSLFGNGTCGDINHINVQSKKQQTTEQIGRHLAQTVLTAGLALEPIPNPELAVARAEIDVPVQRPTPDEVADARTRIGRMDDPKLPFLEKVQAAKVLDLVHNYPDPTTKLEVQAFRLGPKLAIVTLPGEVFVELGLAIKKASPFQTTLVIELVNAVPGYVPTRKAFGEGSYEVVNSRVAPGGGEQLVETALGLLKQLHSSSR